MKRVMIVGQPGSGKSTWAKQAHPDAVRLNRDARGGTLAGLGVLMAFKSIFCRSHAERVWDDYVSGNLPEERASVQVDVVPAVGAESAGVSVFGTF